MPPRRVSPAPRAPPKPHVDESPAAYARRPRIVADATVLAAALFREGEHREAVALLARRATGPSRNQ
jgi:hypothetical protein